MPDAATVSITRAERADVPTLSGALARAFQEDPVFGWVVPDPTHRRERLLAVFAAFADLYLSHGETYAAGDGLGAAVWAPAGGQPFSEEQLQGLGERLVALLGDDAERALELDSLLGEHHPAQPSCYLQFMGVVPEHQGRGIGSRLLTTVLRRCDDTGTPAYLEATSRDNRRLYQRHGFDTTTEINLTQGPPLWAMWREPKT